RANDGSGSPMQYRPQTGVGFWQPTPPAFAVGAFLHWGKVAPFGLARPDQFRPKPPPALTSGRYRRDYNEVKAAGDTLSDINARPQDRINVARYAAMTSPTQMWNDIAVQLSTAEKLTVSENARLFALLNMAIADAAIAVFEAKYVYNFWRPVTAIRAGDLDGNPGTEPDPNYNTFVNSPAYPAYPSGFGALANAGRSLLERMFGRGRHPVTLSLPALSGVTLQYTNLRHITDDVSDARIYSGIHFRFDQEAAETLGERVAQFVLRNNLRCANRNACEDFGDQ
ncbi:MAG TPA: vanadium-dependent haloperoxidase, partial [Bryobacteraceae bacterium]|nr:vanadium-dependent haloperoxidase [Bryobacteraceae bacterium]